MAATVTSANSNFLHNPYDDWKQEVQQYQETKQTWKAPVEPYNKRTTKDFKEKETQYNPITQKFKDQDLEVHVQNLEKQNFLEVIAKNKDRALRYEQTFDVVNFENKLKGLESRADYPKEKPWHFRPGKDTNVDYNILSNTLMAEHHYNPPEKRPQPDEEKKQKIKKTTTTGLRDYNIITGRYLELHDNKLKTDQEIQRAEAANKYWQTHTFDPVNCVYYNPDTEEDFNKEREAEMKIHGKDQVKKLPISVQNEGLMYNPISNEVEDEERLYQRDLREKNKRQRFEVRYDFETYNRKDGLAQIERSDQMKLNKISHMRFKEELDRGFDILTNDPLRGPEATKGQFDPLIQKQRGVWTKALQTVNKGFMTEDQRRAIEDEEEEKRMKATQDFYSTQTEALKMRQTYDPLAATNFDRRSNRLMKGSFAATQQLSQLLAGDPLNTYSESFKDNKPSSILRQAIDTDIGGSNRKSVFKQGLETQTHSQSKGFNATNALIGGSTKNIDSKRNSSQAFSTTASKREIRTGGFQKLGQTIAAK